MKMTPTTRRSDERAALVVFNRGMDPDAAAAHAIVDLLDLVDDAAHVNHYGLTLQMQFNGFGHRRPETVQEVRLFLTAVHAQWPWWMHFLAPQPVQWRTLLLALTPMSRSPVGWTTNMAELQRFVRQLLRANRVLHKHFGGAPADNHMATMQSWKAMKEAFA